MPLSLVRKGPGPKISSRSEARSTVPKGGIKTYSTDGNSRIKLNHVKPFSADVLSRVKYESLREGFPDVLSQKTRYALKALLELSGLPPGATLSAAAIAARRIIPVKFLEAILVELKRDGLIRGQRGRGGGYQLAQSAEVISFGAVVRLMEGPLALLPCVSQTQYRRCTDCTDERTCELRILFREVRDSTATILDGRTLADARRKANPPEARLSALMTKKTNRQTIAKK
jgi:Rrf2 family protein